MPKLVIIVLFWTWIMIEKCFSFGKALEKRDLASSRCLAFVNGSKFIHKLPIYHLTQTFLGRKVLLRSFLPHDFLTSVVVGNFHPRTRLTFFTKLLLRPSLLQAR